MPTEEQIRQLAYALWEQEGSPEGKDQEHYFRAKKMLEDQEKANIVKLAPPPRTASLKAGSSTPKVDQETVKKSAPTQSRSGSRAKKSE
jgi:hypothetical protein